MKNAANTIEDLLETLAGMQSLPKFDIESTDVNIMHSIARQTFKGTALTDRQHALMQEKLAKYKEQFVLNEIDFDNALSNLRNPLRQIDRRKYVKIVDSLSDHKPDARHENHKDKWKWIKIRFPFSKSVIMLINDIQKDNGEYHHEKGSHEHFFKLTEQNAYAVVSAFKNKSFEIDEQLIELYKELQELESRRDEYVPGVYQGKLKNLPDNAVKHLNEQIINNSLIQYYDRRYLFGLHYFDQQDVDNALMKANVITASIAKRKTSNIVVPPSKYNLSDVVLALCELNRFPLIVVLDDNDAIGELSEMHNELKNIFPIEEMSVMFRMDNVRGGIEFNDYVRDHKLNNLVAKDTKVVYINNNKVPKPLINSGWKPRAALKFGADMYHMKMPSKYIEGLDLKLQYASNESLIGRYGLRKRYETI